MLDTRHEAVAERPRTAGDEDPLAVEDAPLPVAGHEVLAPEVRSRER